MTRCCWAPGAVTHSAGTPPASTGSQHTSAATGNWVKPAFISERYSSILSSTRTGRVLKISTIILSCSLGMQCPPHFHTQESNVQQSYTTLLTILSTRQNQRQVGCGSLHSSCTRPALWAADFVDRCEQAKKGERRGRQVDPILKRWVWEIRERDGSATDRRYNTSSNGSISPYLGT
jgi:hypothetical protein